MVIAIIFHSPIFAIIFLVGGTLIPDSTLQVLDADLGKGEYLLHFV